MSKLREIRVGIVTENHFPRLGGMEYYNHFLAQSLGSFSDTKVAIACNAMPEVLKDFPYPYKVFRSKHFSIFTSYLNRRNIEQMICKEKVNVLHGSMLHTGGAKAVEIGKKLGLPIVVQSHGSDVHYVPEIRYGARCLPQMESKIRYALKNANRVIAISKINMDMIKEIASLEEGKVTIVHNGVFYEEICSVPYEDMRAEYNLQPDDFVIITVGRNSPIKRLELLYQAISLIRGYGPGIKCLSVGPKANLEFLANKYRVADLIILTGPVPDINSDKSIFPPFSKLINLYRAADLFVSVSYSEAFCLAGIEALACGIPVLISKMHGLRDIIIEGETGFVLKKETPDELAEKLDLLAQKKWELREKRAFIRNSVSQLSWQNIAEQMREIYFSLIE